VISLSLFWSCISFKINPLYPPEAQIEYINICKSIDDKGDLLEPLDITSEFTLEDENVICIIRLKEIATKIDLRWKWYSPNKNMVRDTENVTVNQDEKYLEVVTAYDMLKLDPEENTEEQWTVVVFINNKFVGRKTFQVRGPSHGLCLALPRL
jgi:hypothetical protein